MTQRSRDYLYQRFRNNQKPNGDDFRDLIDSSVNNAGWYYFRFLPHAGTSPLVDTVLNPEYLNNQNATYTGAWNGNSYDGYMNLQIPRGVTGISHFFLVAYMDIRQRSIAVNLNFGLFALPRTVNPVLGNDASYGRRLGGVRLAEDTLGLHPISREFPIESTAINPEEDALYLRIFSESQHNNNRVAIRLFGLHFTA